MKRPALAGCVGCVIVSCLLAGCGEGELPPTFPDLTVETITAPPTMTVDVPVNISVTITNPGGETAVQPFSVSFAVYDDAGHTNAIRTPTVWDVLQNLDPAADVSHDFTFTPTAADGAITVYFVVTADSAYDVAEDDEDNNESFGQSLIVLPAEPDLTISFSSVPASVQRGGDLVIQVTVTNAGGAPAVAPFTVSVASYADASHTITLWSPETVVEAVDLAAGTNRTYDLTFTARVDDPLGAVYLVATVDSLAQVAESDETNNTAEATSSVVLPPDPDLEILLIAATASMPHEVPQNVSVTITNTGGGTASQPFFVSFNVYDDVALTNAIRPPAAWQVTLPLGPGEQASHDFPFTPTAADGLGFVYFVAEVDSTGVVNEFNETNNSATAISQIQLPPKPDLMTQIYPFPQTSDFLELGVGKIVLEYAITNSGVANALASLTRVELREQGGALVEVLGTFPVPSLAPGGSHTETQNNLTPATVPVLGIFYDIVVIADGSGVIDEEIESNNEDLHTILIY